MVVDMTAAAPPRLNAGAQFPEAAVPLHRDHENGHIVLEMCHHRENMMTIECRGVGDDFLPGLGHHGTHALVTGTYRDRLMQISEILRSAEDMLPGVAAGEAARMARGVTGFGTRQQVILLGSEV